MWEHFEEWYSLVNQYFPSDQYLIVQNRAWIKRDPLRL